MTASNMPSSSGAVFRPATTLGEHASNVLMGTTRRRRYHLGVGGVVWTELFVGNVLMTPVADPVPGLAAAINRGKRAGGQSTGGAFIVTEHGHVLVPSEGRVFCVGVLRGTLVFKDHHGDVVSAAGSAEVKPGDEWAGPFAGSRYVLTAGCTDVRGESSDGARLFLSDEIGPHVAAAVAQQWRRTRTYGGRLYINEAGLVISQVERNARWTDVYLGRIDIQRWFAEPPCGR